MATPQNQKMSAHDQIMRLKQLEKDSKMKEKELKRQTKLRKQEAKRRKKLEKRRRKLAKKGIILPELEQSLGPSQVGAPPSTATPATAAGMPITRTIPAPEETLTEAEVITAEADVWTPQSARNIDEIEKRVDRMDKDRIQSLRERYKERYGEDLEIPDAYNVESTLDVDTAEQTGELEPVETKAQTTDEQALKTKEDSKGLGFGAFGRKDKKKDKSKAKDKLKIDRPVRFLDLRKPLYLVSKFTTKDSGIGRKIILGIIDIIILLICIILLFIPMFIRIIGTIYYVRRDKLDQELFESMVENGSQPQPTT